MTRYGPWVQPEDTWALSDSWAEGGLESEGDPVDHTDPTAFAGSVTDVIAGTNVIFDITVGDTSNVAYSPASHAAHIDVVGTQALAWGRLYVFQPQLDSLFFGPVVPGIWPTNAIDYELEEPEGDPLPGTIKVYGYVMQRSYDATGAVILQGSVIRRLVPGDYILDGFGRPVTTWVEALNPAGATLATFAAPTAPDTYQTDPFEITDLSTDANDLIVFSVTTDALHSTWGYSEFHDVQLLQTPLVSPPSTGQLPIFGQLYTPPRYRWVYDEIAPLRQYPRDDGLAFGSVQRTFPRPASIQRGPRQRIGGYA